jgi:Tfp pilus assembly protein PilF
MSLTQEENDCLIELAAIQEERGDHGKAEETYRKAMSVMPEDVGISSLRWHA